MLKSYLAGAWAAGSGKAQTLYNPATEEAVVETCAEGLDLAAGLAHAREAGCRALAEMSLAERGALLSKIAAKIHEHRDELLDIARINGGNTRGDAKFDVDGASGTLAHYAELASTLKGRYVSDGDNVQLLGHSPRLAGRHVFLPRQGVALLINAFNFPAWGFGEKAACALLRACRSS